MPRPSDAPAGEAVAEAEQYLRHPARQARIKYAAMAACDHQFPDAGGPCVRCGGFYGEIKAQAFHCERHL